MDGRHCVQAGLWKHGLLTGLNDTVLERSTTAKPGFSLQGELS